MKAAELLRNVPLGALIAFSDGTPRPPERFNKKLSAWKNKNGTGLLTSKSGGEVLAGSTHVGRAHFGMRVGEYGGAGFIAIIVNSHFDEASDLDFTVLELPQGVVRINSQGELVPPQDIAARASRGYSDPQPGEREEPAFYGAGFPSMINPGDEADLDLPGVKTFIRHKSLLGSYSASVLAVRDDGYTVRFPGTFCNALMAALDGKSDEAKRRLLLALLKRREDGEALELEDLAAVPA